MPAIEAPAITAAEGAVLALVALGEGELVLVGSTAARVVKTRVLETTKPVVEKTPEEISIEEMIVWNSTTVETMDVTMLVVDCSVFGAAVVGGGVVGGGVDIGVVGVVGTWGVVPGVTVTTTVTGRYKYKCYAKKNPPKNGIYTHTWRGGDWRESNTRRESNSW